MYNKQNKFENIFYEVTLIMKKLIVIDLDGTLLNSEGEVSDENKEAIKAAKEKGAIVILASGRMPRAIKSYAQDIGADKYIICGNGAIIYDIETDEEIYNQNVAWHNMLERSAREQPVTEEDLLYEDLMQNHNNE